MQDYDDKEFKEAFFGVTKKQADKFLKIWELCCLTEWRRKQLAEAINFFDNRNTSNIKIDIKTAQRNNNLSESFPPRQGIQWALSRGYLIHLDIIEMTKEGVDITSLPDAEVIFQCGESRLGGKETNQEAEDPAPSKSTNSVAETNGTNEESFAQLFDPVTVPALEKMFPANGKWRNWSDKAKANGLKNARIGRAKFNPYDAAIWFFNKGADGWDMARIRRVLANNLPERSLDYKHLLIDDID